MYRFWNTGDLATDANLTALEGIATEWPDIELDNFMDQIRALIGYRAMLPCAVLTHFDLPNLMVGAEPERWSRDRLRQKAIELQTAVATGLARAWADDTLKAAGGADLSDRPSTKGEEVSAALGRYRLDRSDEALHRLREACYATPLNQQMERLDKWLARKRPSSPDRPIEREIADILGEMSRRASELHYLPASYRFDRCDPSRA